MSNTINPCSNAQAQPKKLNKVKVGSIAGSAIGIAGAVAGVYAMAKHGNPAASLKNLAYQEKDVLLVGAGSVLGGLAGGLLTDENKENVKPKLREASQQFLGNMACPIGLLALNNKLLNKAGINHPLVKVAVTVGSLLGGMGIGNKVMNVVNNKIFKEEVKHDVHAEDMLVHADDLCLAANMMLKDVPSVTSVTAKVLPATFLVAGAKTGMQKA